jgi:hypothetical protein
MPVAEFLEARCVRHERHEEFARFDKDDFDPTTSSSFRSLQERERPAPAQISVCDSWSNEFSPSRPSKKLCCSCCSIFVVKVFD